jgi:hypothetical protein
MAGEMLDLRALDDERAAIERERLGELGAIGDRRVGSELAAILVQQPALGSLGLQFWVTLIKVSQDSSNQGKPGLLASRSPGIRAERALRGC